MLYWVRYDEVEMDDKMICLVVLLDMAIYSRKLCILESTKSEKTKLKNGRTLKNKVAGLIN